MERERTKKKKRKRREEKEERKRIDDKWKRIEEMRIRKERKAKKE